jgi:hypothetical protein
MSVSRRLARWTVDVTFSVDEPDLIRQVRLHEGPTLTDARVERGRVHGPTGRDDRSVSRSTPS